VHLLVLSSFSPENPEGGEMYLLVLAHPGCPRQSPESHKMVVVVVVVVTANEVWNRIIDFLAAGVQIGIKVSTILDCQRF